MTIKQKQWQLYFLGYYGGKIDGIWGEKSRAATKQFRADNGLEPDFDFDHLTESKSIEIIKKIQKIVGTTVDGLAGANTVAKTITYQRKNGLTPDGIAGVKTRAKMGITDTKTTTTTKPESTKPESTTASGDFWDGIKHFKRSEFKCKCGKHCNGFPVEPKEKLVKVADRVREHFGNRITVSSGVRCEQHNANVGGVANSRHKQGKAMDFCVSGMSASMVLTYVQKQPEIRYAYAIDSNYVHMDIE